MDNPRYSILTTDIFIIKDIERIRLYNSLGIKTILFLSEKLNLYDDSFEVYKKAGLLEVKYSAEDFPKVIIYDGKMDSDSKSVVDFIAAKCQDFNKEQYFIEHADKDALISVSAGAGTGKTKVMIDRILFLLHTDSSLSLEEIALITFTRDATLQMRERLENKLMQLFKATKSIRYLKWLEAISNINIKTIHSFSRNLIKLLSSSSGYGNKFNIRGFRKERKEIITEVLDEFYGSEKGKINEILGIPLNEISKLIELCWEKFDNLGITINEIDNYDWGKASNISSKNINNVLKKVFKRVYCKYDEIKHINNAISVEDIVRDLSIILKNNDVKLDLNLKYLFVDEFQDSDNSQIYTLAFLQRCLGLKLFIVGDIKQCIYRFRGAVETSIMHLNYLLNHYNSQKLLYFELVKNYRTGSDLAKDLNHYFYKWYKSNLLPNFSKIECGPKAYSLPLKLIKCKYANINKIEEITIEELRKTISSCINYEKNKKICLLTRTNNELNSIVDWCGKASIPCCITKEGTFYNSKAVIDFFCLVRGFLFRNSPQAIFDMVNSSYFILDKSLKQILENNNDKDDIVVEIKKLINKTFDINLYYKFFRLKPVLSVLKDLVELLNPFTNFKIKQEFYYKKKNLFNNNDNLKKQVDIDAKQYLVNFNKLFDIFRDNFTSDATSLYSIYDFLKVKIATDKKEDEPNITEDNNIIGMTVHKAKGLEFDTVIIPFTYRKFFNENRTDFIVDKNSHLEKNGGKNEKNKIGWRYCSENNVFYQNDNYLIQQEDEMENIRREETRLLYVAMTRAMRKLVIVSCGEEDTWANLLR